MRYNEPATNRDFYRILFSDDSLSAVLRAHIHLEARLNQLIRDAVPRPDELPNLPFKQTVQLGAALGLTSDAIGPLCKLGELRNQFGHRLDAELTMGNVESVWKAFSTDAQQEVRSMYERIPDRLVRGWPSEFDAAEPRLRLIFIALYLDRVLRAAENTAV